MCKNCKKLKSNQLYKQRKRLSLEPDLKRKRTSDTASTNFRYLNREELIEKLKNAQTKKWELTRRVAKLNKRIQEDLHQKGVSVCE